MPRIPREEHLVILRRVDQEGHKVAEVAAAYGCTPANIYAILGRLRRQGAGIADVAPASGQTSTEPTPAPIRAAADDLFTRQPEAARLPTAPPPSVDPAPAPLPAAVEAPPQPAPPAAEPPRPPLKPSAPSRVGQGAALAKSARPAPPPRAGRTGYALLMRTSDGDEAVHPFRGLDELLSAAKPILRTAARSPEPIWFSIQPVDLDTLDEDG